jgi:hypothetical protein
LTTDHPTSEILDQLLAGTLAPLAAHQDALAHLAAPCEVCGRYVRAARYAFKHAATMALAAPMLATPQAIETPQAVADATRLGTLPVGDHDAEIHDMARNGAGLATIRADELQAAACWTMLAGTPPAQRMRLAMTDPRFHSWALASRLLESGDELQGRELWRPLEACRLAVAIAERLGTTGYPSGLRGDLRARAQGRLADLLRQDDLLGDAKAMLERAWDALEEGTGDPLERAALLGIEADLDLSRGDFAAAAELLRTAAAMYRRRGDRHQEGRTLQKLALAIGFEHPAQGVATAQRALALVDGGREPDAELAARHTLSWFLTDCGLGWQALDHFERSRSLFKRLCDDEWLLRMAWLEPRICRSLGQLVAAERGLAAAWHGFRRAGCAQELTLVSLDLAEAYLAQGKSRHALHLLTGFQGTLRWCGMHAEGMAAWLLLVETVAANMGRAPALTREASLYFRRAWRRRVVFAPRR